MLIDSANFSARTDAVQHVEQLHVGRQTTRPDAHVETALGHVIEQRGLAGDLCRMVVGQADHARAKADVLGLR